MLAVVSYSIKPPDCDHVPTRKSVIPSFGDSCGAFLLLMAASVITKLCTKDLKRSCMHRKR